MELDIKQLMAEYEEMEKVTDKMKKDADRKQMEVDYAKNDIKELIEQLNEKGIEFSNVSELQGQFESEKESLAQVIQSTKRKLAEVQS